MITNKKAQWMWLVMGLLAVAVFLVSWFIIGPALGGADTTIKNLQSCEGRQGHCETSESACKPGEYASFKSLGCGNEKDKERKDKPWCCLPS